MPPVITYGQDDMRSWRYTPMKRLSESALQQHVKSSKAQEETPLTRPKSAPKSDCRPVDKPSMSPSSIEQLSGQLHQDTQGSLSPMERFVKLSMASDPSPWETKRILKESGFQDGCTRDVDFRLNEAAIEAVRGSMQRVGGPSIVAIAKSTRGDVMMTPRTKAR
ncbi:hypothetical protein Q7P35_007342 [Cladosporium inversicolor]